MSDIIISCGGSERKEGLSMFLKNKMWMYVRDRRRLMLVEVEMIEMVEMVEMVETVDMRETGDYERYSDIRDMMI